MAGRERGRHFCARLLDHAALSPLRLRLHRDVRRLPGRLHDGGYHAAARDAIGIGAWRRWKAAKTFGGERWYAEDPLPHKEAGGNTYVQKETRWENPYEEYRRSQWLEKQKMATDSRSPVVTTGNK